MSWVQNGNLILTGKLHTDRARLKVGLGYQNSTPNSIEFQLDKVSHLSYSGLLPTFWAQQKIDKLFAGGKTHKAEILDIGMSYNMVTPYTSLIVLDRIEDYVNYRIPPPELELMAEYEELVARAESEKEIEWLSHLDKTAEEFLARRVWWETNFGVPLTPFKPDPIKKDLDANQQEDDFSSFEESNMEDLFEEEEKVDKKKDDTEGESQNINLNPWSPNAPYLDSMKSTSPAYYESIYWHFREIYQEQAGFFLDMADFFFAKGDTLKAIRILSNLAEIGQENHELHRVLAHRLETWGYLDWALNLYMDIRDLRPEEPQSWRDLALCYDRNGQLQDAVDVMYQVVKQPWADRFRKLQFWQPTK